MQKVSTCLWFDDQAREAAEFYVSVFPDSRLIDIKYYGEGVPRPAGSVLAVRFALSGSEFTALNGGPGCSFSPAISLVANCRTQAEVDTLWAKLSEGGQTGRCGWLTDRFGVSWQVVPEALFRVLSTEDAAASQRAFEAMRTMTKLDIVALEAAYRGD